MRACVLSGAERRQRDTALLMLLMLMLLMLLMMMMMIMVVVVVVVVVVTMFARSGAPNQKGDSVCAGGLARSDLRALAFKCYRCWTDCSRAHSSCFLFSSSLADLAQQDTSSHTFSFSKYVRQLGQLSRNPPPPASILPPPLPPISASFT